MTTDITPDPAVALDAASLAALENTTVTVGAALPAGTNNIGDVDVLSSALPTGAATETTLATLAASASVLDDWDETDRAKVNPIAGQAGVQGGAGAVSALTQRVVLATDQTVIPVGDNSGSLTVDGTVAATQSGTWNVGTVTTVTAVTAISNALPAGSNAIGKLAANSGVDIGDVDVTTVGTITPGTAATSLGKAEDAAHTTGDVGVMALAVRNDTGAVLAGTTADYVPLSTNAFGDLRVGSIDPSQQIHKAVTVTTTQTGSDVWSPASGKKIAVTNLILGSYGTTAARVILWFGDNADTTYSAGTDQVLAAASFAPSATSKPGLVYTPANPIYCATADRELHLTTDAGISLDITVEGFEW